MTERIYHLLGDWDGIENIIASEWGPAGQAIAHIECRLQLNGKVLLQDYSAERDAKPWLSAHAVFTVEQGRENYRLFWFDSLGFVPEHAAPGSWHDDELHFVRQSARGLTRHRYTFNGSEEYRLSLESSFDDGQTWVDVMHGHYRRIG